MIPIFNTYIHPSARQLVAETIESTFISEGKLVARFEERLQQELGILNPIALNSGTSALHLALVVAGIQAGDEVICPAQTFVATALVVVQEGATPVFADIDYETGNIDASKVESYITPRTKAIMAVHWGGYPCDMDELKAVAKKHNLLLIEDAAHAPGATYKGQAIGAISDITCFSFQAIKHITTGDGGAVAFLNKDLAHEAYKRRWFGIDRKNTQLGHLGERLYDIDKVGFKYHMNDYAAALGLANLNDFSERLAYRRRLAAIYTRGLEAVSGVKVLKHKNDREGAYWLFGLHVEKRDAFIEAMKNKGITASIAHSGIDKNSVFGGKRMNLEAQRKFDATQIHIPIHDAVSVEQAEYIVASIQSGW